MQFLNEIMVDDEWRPLVDDSFIMVFEADDELPNSKIVQDGGIDLRCNTEEE